MKYQFEVPGEIVGKERPRCNTCGRDKAGVYTFLWKEV